jgi:hypothetical protein
MLEDAADERTSLDLECGGKENNYSYQKLKAACTATSLKNIYFEEVGQLDGSDS